MNLLSLAFTGAGLQTEWENFLIWSDPVHLKLVIFIVGKYRLWFRKEASSIRAVNCYSDYRLCGRYGAGEECSCLQGMIVICIRLVNYKPKIQHHLSPNILLQANEMTTYFVYPSLEYSRKCLLKTESLANWLNFNDYGRLRLPVPLPPLFTCNGLWTRLPMFSSTS
jgi:hypothetical protein